MNHAPRRITAANSISLSLTHTIVVAALTHVMFAMYFLGLIPETFGNLLSLKVLDLGENNLAGEHPPLPRQIYK